MFFLFFKQRVCNPFTNHGGSQDKLNIDEQNCISSVCNLKTCFVGKTSEQLQILYGVQSLWIGSKMMCFLCVEIFFKAGMDII
mgnify:CR=1 FL=1